MLLSTTSKKKIQSFQVLLDLSASESASEEGGLSFPAGSVTRVTTTGRLDAPETLLTLLHSGFISGNRTENGSVFYKVETGFGVKHSRVIIGLEDEDLHGARFGYSDMTRPQFDRIFGEESGHDCPFSEEDKNQIWKQAGGHADIRKFAEKKLIAPMFAIEWQGPVFAGADQAGKVGFFSRRETVEGGSHRFLHRCSCRLALVTILREKLADSEPQSGSAAATGAPPLLPPGPTLKLSLHLHCSCRSM